MPGENEEVHADAGDSTEPVEAPAMCIRHKRSEILQDIQNLVVKEAQKEESKQAAEREAGGADLDRSISEGALEIPTSKESELRENVDQLRRSDFREAMPKAVNESVDADFDQENDVKSDFIVIPPTMEKKKVGS